jgi:DNA-nicking Smr family endonuclease
VKEAPQRPHRLRRLSDEEIALWREVARGVKRRRGAALPTASGPGAGEPAPAPPQAAEALRSRPAQGAAPPLAPIERRLRRELARGRAAIDAALDLHGLTQAEAHQALRGFLRHSQTRGARLVIVVTGKGGLLDAPAPWPHERGVLRRLVPHWLRESDLRSVVLGFEEAGRAHGGSGALYVRLRRPQGASARDS